ncbi:MAG: LysE family translocator [Micromonosporaceae bacterium]|nr:LysE family translocator [Micromonosporaceae bacterium]
MPEVSTLLLFAAAAAVMLLVPGPSVLYIVTRSVAQGRGAGLVSVLGIHVGSAVHVFAAVLGLSALLASSATAFTIVKYLGAAYLIWLGIQHLRSRGQESEPTAPPAPRRRLFWDGVVVNVLNPKTAIFFLAFLPQFVDPSRGPAATQLAMLGACFIALGTISDGTYALTAGTLAGRLRRAVRARRRLDRASGAVYLGMGVTAALSGESPA